MARKELAVDSVAEAYLALLAERGVEYLFANAGTDFAPLVEAFAKAARTGMPVPRPVIATHENLAVSMAHGWAMVTGRRPGGHGACQRRHRQRRVRRLQRRARERADAVHRRPLAVDRGGDAGRARRLHPLGAGDVRPGRDGARDRQMGLRAEERPAARNRGRPRPRPRRQRAARAGLPVVAARGAGRAPAGLRL